MGLGIQVEFSQKVAKIRTKNRKIVGITLKNGTSIDADIVVCGAYPHVVYKHMIEPLSDVDKKALKMVNAMETGVSCFSLVMLLDDDYQNLGIKDYSTFVTNNELDTSYTFESGYHISNWDFLTAVCPNVIIKDASRKGTCIYSITYLPHGLSLKDLKAEEYESFKNEICSYFLESESKRLGVDLKKHILEMSVETPITISRYTGAYLGSIYGYRHKMNNSVIARQQVDGKEEYIKNLFFVGAHQMNGDGMAPSINNGKKVALDVLKRLKKQRRIK